jgi:hypothetical protein
MPSWLTNILQVAGLTTPAIYALAVVQLFRWLDSKASDEAKTAISNWLQSKDYNTNAVGSATIEMFDRVYTPHLFSWNAFLRSGLFTACVTVIVLFEIYYGEESETYFLFHPSSSEAFRNELASFGTSIIPNIITDYVSLFAVRRLLVLAKGRPLFALWIGPLVGISIVGLFNLAINDALLALYFWWDSGDDYLYVFYNVITYNFTIPEWRALLAAACVVHLWLPLFAVSVGLLRVVGWMQWFFRDGRQHPYEVIGYMSAGIVLVGAFTFQRI